ncbi:MAG: trypsin-like peptidase domain-containing protein [Bacteroidota bacterium]
MRAITTIAIAFLAGIAGAYFFELVKNTNEKTEEAKAFTNVFNPSSEETFVQPTRDANAASVDFSDAASRATPSVVYINSIAQSGVSYTYWDMLFGGGGSHTQVSSGSGVIFSSDGYIVTNNHVVESAEKIQVLFRKNVYDAELVGTDPSTDLAVLKIKESGLPAITLGSSKNLAVGEWVIAVGNPFSLASTVTAGIVSAKGRRINIVEDKFPIESFIQTDAAINPGNSGGALVNKNGELVGINTAILSRTGSYTGYAFAVPVDIARKVVEDLIKYGVSQRANLGATIGEYDFQNARKFGLDTNIKNFRGVLVEKVDAEGSAARAAGLQAGDIITRVDDEDIDSESAFEEKLSYRSPGDKINITYNRNGKQSTTSITLLNRFGDTALVRRKIYSDTTLGANLEAVEYGVKIFKLKDGLLQRIGLPENYTIVAINRQRIRDPQDVIDFFTKYKGRVLVQGLTSSKEQLPLEFFLK